MSSKTHTSLSTSSGATSSTASSAPVLPSITPPASATQSVSNATSTSSGSGGGGSGGAPSGLGGSTSLYLYTFLATLVLLLGVSGAIVIRSYILRRRHQALVEEAIRNGTWVPPAFRGGGRRGGRRDVGEKPVMWDAWVGKDREVMDALPGKGVSVGGWSDLLPISASYLNQRPTSSPRTTSTESTATRGHVVPTSRTRTFFPWRRAHTPPPPVISPPVTPAVPLTPVVPSASSPDVPATPAVSATPTLRLTVLIAMPAPLTTNHQSHPDDEEGPLVVELGVVDVKVASAQGPAEDGTLEAKAENAASA